MGGSDTGTPAIVSPCFGANGLAAIRQLGRVGVEVVGVDSSPLALGFRSRYARSVLAPRPLHDEEGYIAAIEAVSDQLGRPAVFFPTTDESLNAVSRHRDRLAERLLCPFPESSVVAAIQDKWHQIRVADAAGVPIPRTSARPTDEFGYPVLVKPADPPAFQAEFDGLHAFRCRNRTELDDAFERSAPFRPLVQEFIPGDDTSLHTFGAYINRDGEALGVFSGRKLRQTPPVVGTCRVGEARWVEDVVRQGLRYCEALGFTGVCQVEFKRDARSGEFKLMEINPRLWQWHGLAAKCGIDVVLLAYLDLTGANPKPAQMTHEGYRWAITILDRRLAVQRPPYADAYFSLDDPRPAATLVARQASWFVRNLHVSRRRRRHPGRKWDGVGDGANAAG